MPLDQPRSGGGEFLPEVASCQDNSGVLAELVFIDVVEWTSDELRAACVASLEVCYRSCARSDSFIGVLQQDACQDDCEQVAEKCRAGIEMRTRLKNTANTGNRARDPGVTPGVGGATGSKGGTLTPSPYGSRIQKGGTLSPSP